MNSDQAKELLRDTKLLAFLGDQREMIERRVAEHGPHYVVLVAREDAKVLIECPFTIAIVPQNELRHFCENVCGFAEVERAMKLFLGWNPPGEGMRVFVVIEGGRLDGAVVSYAGMEDAQACRLGARPMGGDEQRNFVEWMSLVYRVSDQCNTPNSERFRVRYMSLLARGKSMVPQSLAFGEVPIFIITDIAVAFATPRVVGLLRQGKTDKAAVELLMQECRRAEQGQAEEAQA